MPDRLAVGPDGCNVINGRSGGFRYRSGRVSELFPRTALNAQDQDPAPGRLAKLEDSASDRRVMRSTLEPYKLRF